MGRGTAVELNAIPRGQQPAEQGVRRKFGQRDTVDEPDADVIDRCRLGIAGVAAKVGIHRRSRNAEVLRGLVVLPRREALGVVLKPQVKRDFEV